MKTHVLHAHQPSKGSSYRGQDVLDRAACAELDVARNAAARTAAAPARTWQCGRTDPMDGARRTLPFANALMDSHDSKCSPTIYEMAHAMEPTPTSDGHRNRPNAHPLKLLGGARHVAIM